MKCLCFYHPDDPAELKERQEATLLAVHDACRAGGREPGFSTGRPIQNPCSAASNSASRP
ncbi:MAG: 2-deoxy-5-keto-D-gluconate 6-phosphate aldolase domain-containing protein [Microvirga sp.]